MPKKADKRSKFTATVTPNRLLQHLPNSHRISQHHHSRVDMILFQLLQATTNLWLTYQRTLCRSKLPHQLFRGLETRTRKITLTSLPKHLEVPTTIALHPQLVLDVRLLLSMSLHRIAIDIALLPPPVLGKMLLTLPRCRLRPFLSTHTHLDDSCRMVIQWIMFTLLGIPVNPH